MFTSHVLDMVLGKPASGMQVEIFTGEKLLASAWTDENGRIRDFKVETNWESACYRLRFGVAAYFAKQELGSLYPWVDIHLEAVFPGSYHIPLILAPNGYSTYRGS